MLVKLSGFQLGFFEAEHSPIFHQPTQKTTMATTSPATLTTVAEFPEHYMLENLAVRTDGSILVVASPQRELWYIPVLNGSLPVKPLLLHTFDDGQLAQCVIEVTPGIFYAATYGKPTLQRFDLRNWQPGSPVSVSKVFDFEEKAGPNGICLIAPGVLLISDCVEGLIWRVELSDDGMSATAKVWLKDKSMAAGGGKPPVKFSDSMSVPFPGINGLRYGPKTNRVYWSTSSLEVFMSVAVNPTTHDATGDVFHIADVKSVDDFCLDEDAGVGYLARHPDHIIERVPLKPGASKLSREVMAGQPFTDQLIGPTSVSWGRQPGDYGRVAYTTTDGGTVKLAPDGQLRPARLMRIEFPAS